MDGSLLARSSIYCIAQKRLDGEARACTQAPLHVGQLDRFDFLWMEGIDSTLLGARRLVLNLASP